MPLTPKMTKTTPTTPATDKGNILGIDVGERRIGVAIASIEARLPRVLETIDVQKQPPLERLQNLIIEHRVRAIVVGLPRNLDGNDTQQTKKVMAFIAELENKTTLPVFTTDEALSSQLAEAELKNAGKAYAKADIDATAAALILDDWLVGGVEP